MPDVAIVTEGIGKRYGIHAKGACIDADAKSPEATDHLWAIRDINLSITQGSIVGLIGANGSGKSTLLKVLSRITAPTCGRATIVGRLVSLLEVATGFHPDLSGRENIYINGAMMGLSRKEITTRFDSIVAFAQVAQYIDEPVKRYSTGMMVRLGFAVAGHLEPDILLIDEVLATADVAFQRQCFHMLSQAAQTGCTVIFVSHQLQAVRHLCQRTLWLDQGRMRNDGPTDDILAAYDDHVRAADSIAKDDRSETPESR